MAVAEQWTEESALKEIAPFRDEPGGLLPALRALQSCFGAIDERAVGLLERVEYDGRDGDLDIWLRPKEKEAS